MKKSKSAGLGIESLVIFENLRDDKVLKPLSKLLRSENSDIKDKITYYRDFVSELYSEGENLTEYVLQKVFEDENIYTIKKGLNQKISPNMQACVKAELKGLEKIATLSQRDVAEKFFKEYNGFLPSWDTSKHDFQKEYSDRMAHISKHGYGIFARNTMFSLNEKGEIIPVKYPDAINVSDLIGYENERQKVIDNTEALLSGHRAANVLLTGDAGTGKSTTVKAIANKYSSDGLRLIEITKQQIVYIPKIMEKICTNPLKFIIFIDDLTFGENDSNFASLKAILEGSVSARSQNAVIYATSNRRHMVKETISDRSGDDLHRNDTIQELVSLSERFGLRVTFSKPNKSLYLEIVKGLCEKEKLDIPDAELESGAEAFALRRSGRSARAARQYVEFLETKYPKVKKEKNQKGGKQ